jgi:foldase protein PrsA
VQLLYQKLLARHSQTVTNAQIAAYYNSHRSQFGTAESRNLHIVLTSTLAQANAAKRALASGQSWAAVAKKYSIDPATKDKGGVLNNVSEGQTDQALQSAAFSAPLNKVIGPIHGQFGYYVVNVTKIVHGNQKSLAQATPSIKQTLESQQQSAAQNAVNSEAKKDWMPQTHCLSEYAISQCSGYKAPKTSTTSTTSTG